MLYVAEVFRDVCLSWFPVNLAKTEALGFITGQDHVKQDKLLMTESTNVITSNYGKYSCHMGTPDSSHNRYQKCSQWLLALLVN